MDLATSINSFNNIAHNRDNETIVHQYVLEINSLSTKMMLITVATNLSWKRLNF